MTATPDRILITPLNPFPRISWWVQVLDGVQVYTDMGEPFRKMTDRNRYAITGSNNAVLLSIPLEGGRDQRQPMGDVKICNKENWQIRHLRTLISVYRRTPFFEHYEPGLTALFARNDDRLVDFNQASIQWVSRQLKLPLTVQNLDSLVLPESVQVSDLRMEERVAAAAAPFPTYYQIFSDRNGFQPNLSILDLLFSEGPATLTWLRQNQPVLNRLS